MGVRVEERPDGGLTLAARERPLCLLVGCVAVLPGGALLAWGAATGHAIEASGGLVLVAFGALLLHLGLRGLRTVDLTPGVRVVVRSGVGPLARREELPIDGPTRVAIEPFPLPDGAPDLPDRGGDLVLVGERSRLRLVRLTGHSARHLGGLRDRLARRLHG